MNQTATSKCEVSDSSPPLVIADFIFFQSNTISMGKRRFVYHKLPVGYARETGHSPQAQGKSMGPRLDIRLNLGSSFSQHITTRATVIYAPNLYPMSWLRSACFWLPSLVPWPGRRNRALLRLQHKALVVLVSGEGVVPRPT